MINLLPPQKKNDVHYARRNVIMTQFVVGAIVGIVGIVIVIAAGQFYIARSTKTMAAQVDHAKQHLAAQKLEETQKKVEDLSNNIKLVLQVLGREVLFSKLLLQIGAVMPEGATLESLTIGSVEGGIDLGFSAKTYQTATQVQINLQDPKNNVFSKADIVDINCPEPANANTIYPCHLALRALFGDNNPYLFLQPPKATEVKP
jgi:hypothetical protein